ncbi:nicotinamide riboside kinase 2 isoform X1 [Alosa alosa]|uniref:nicotinamide riboside kinase 2 isoform X1 n=1 Tax=Alosa alosa TaxID=278164 RepID=UPI0020150AE4|nr:nicotinamide riboside kinase 2 isoform X1 [Alosa alosa]
MQSPCVDNVNYDTTDDNNPIKNPVNLQLRRPWLLLSQWSCQVYGSAWLSMSRCDQHCLIHNAAMFYWSLLFQPQDQIEVGEDGFRQWDVIEALDMEAMVNTVKGWLENPVKFARSHGVTVSPLSEDPERDTHILLVEGFLIYNYKPLAEIYDKCYYISIPYEECKRRRSSRTYTVPDPPGLFDGHVWPMYLKHRKEMDNNCNAIVYLDGLKSKDEIYSQVFGNIQNTLLNS